MHLLIVFLVILAIRLASVFIVQTYYVPDEYWQSLEVAHKLTFGYGYLTWEWVQGIRSYVYPALFAFVYKLLAFLNLDTVELLVLIPRILQATLTAYSDYRFYIWTGKRKWALFIILVPWFWFYTGSRTLSNTLEASLTTIALSYFPWHGESTTYLWPAAICCFLRPTAAVIWLPLCLYHIRNTKQSPVELVLKRFLVVGVLVAAVGISIDTYLHGELILTPYQFLKYNIFHNIGSFYGSHPWYWYFTIGLPTVLGINFLPFLYATIETIRKSDRFPVRKQLLSTIIFALAVLSTVEHKEFRFVVSLLPLCLYITADALVRLSYTASRSLLWFIAGAIVLGNVLPGWYLSTVHQKGPLELMPKLQQIARVYRDERDQRASILFLMPCHSTPYYSHIHENITMRFLTCEPNIKHLPDYNDEANQFFDSPVHWLNSHLPSYPRTALPTHVVLFDSLAERINEFLLNYKLLHSIQNAEVNQHISTQKLIDEASKAVREKKLNVDSLLQHVQARTGKNILVYQRLAMGEENLFNRNENQAGSGAGTGAGAGIDPSKKSFVEADETYFENEHNVFN